jgi:hypothetical protein
VNADDEENIVEAMRNECGRKQAGNAATRENVGMWLIDENEDGWVRAEREGKQFCDTGSHTDDPGYHTCQLGPSDTQELGERCEGCEPYPPHLCERCKAVIALQRQEGEFEEGDCLACLGFMVGCGYWYLDAEYNRASQN